MKQAGKQQNQIATVLGVSPSTINQELTRNTGLQGHRPKQTPIKSRYSKCLSVRKAE